MNTSWGFFPFDAGEYKAAQAWLDGRAARGWRLKRVYLGWLARFEPAESPSHFVDLDTRRALEGEPDQDYLQLCSDSGWELVQILRGMLLFRAREGARPIPIQTDGGMEWDRFWRRAARNAAVTAAVLLAAVLLLWLSVSLSRNSTTSRGVLALAASNGALLHALAMAGMLIVLVWQGAAALSYLLRCRRSGAMETPSVRMCLARGAVQWAATGLLVAGWLVMLLEAVGVAGVTVDLSTNPFREEDTATVEACRAYPVVMARDLGLDDGEVQSRYLDGRRSALMDSLSYSELVDGPEGTLIITCRRYAYRWEWLASWCAGREREETGRGAFLWGELPWEETALPGFDESYVCRDNGYLLLRAGTAVALVGCSQGVDLTEPDIQAMLWDRLNL